MGALIKSSTLQVQPEPGTLAPFVPRALLARLARPIEVLAETVDCTLVFADVSGFTRLSERLARRGDEGAEQLVDVINACFTALLAEAYGRGGSLVKFGGDAMVLLFYDQEANQEHAMRACCAAAAMRRRLREVGRVRAGDSNVVLRMSVGVHSGTYPMFVVGRSHRELVIGGAGDDHARRASRQPRPRARSWSAPRPPGCCPAAPWARAADPASCSGGPPADRASGCRRRGSRPRPRRSIESFLPVAVRAHLRERIDGPRASHGGDRLPSFRRPRRGDRATRDSTARRGGSTRSFGSSRTPSSATTCASSTRTSRPTASRSG